MLIMLIYKCCLLAIINKSFLTHRPFKLTRTKEFIHLRCTIQMAGLIIVIFLLDYFVTKFLPENRKEKKLIYQNQLKVNNLIYTKRKENETKK